MDFSEHFPDTSSSLALACRSGDLNTLKRLINDGKSPESQDNRGWRPIHEAACWNRADCLKLLIENGVAQINSYTFEGQTPLWIACYYNSIEAAQVLLHAGAGVNLPNNEDVTPLHSAASKGHSEIVTLLIAHGANVNLPDYGLYTPMHEAAIEGHEKIVKLLLENGSEKTAQDSHGRTPLFCGAQAHKCLVVRLLADASSSVIIDLRSYDGATALMLAAQAGCLDCVQYLISKRANPNLKANDGVMAVHLALIGDYKTVLEYLLDITDHRIIAECCNLSKNNQNPSDILAYENQARISWQQSNQESINIFLLAVTYERVECIKLLLKKGLHPDHFPCVWKHRNHISAVTLNLTYDFATPLSFILSYFPFERTSYVSVKELVEHGSSIQAIGPQFVPPIVALLYVQERADIEQQSSLMMTTLNYLFQCTNQIRAEEISTFMTIAFFLKPPFFLEVLHHGYLFDEIFFSRGIKLLLTLEKEKVHHKACTALHSAGFLPTVMSELIPTIQGGFQDLKQLCRVKVRACLWKANTSQIIPIRSLSSLTLPSTLISYLCFDDVSF